MTGLALLVLGAGTVVCAAVGAAYDDPDAAVLGVSGLIIALVGLLGWRITRPPERLSRLSAFTAVSFAWIVVPLFATLPYLWAGTFDRFVNAWFEAVSGLTTTGSTVLADIEAQGEGIRLYRQYTQWFGGGGIVLLAVAIIQGFGVGGLELAGAEIAGPTSERLTPRIAATARRLWTVYAGLTGAVAVGFLVVGMGVYDAIAHAMATIPTAGFSTYNASFNQFDSAAVEAVAIVGMLAGATNFALHYRGFSQGPRRYLQAPEFRFFIGLFVGAVALVTALNMTDGMSVLTALRVSAFNVTTTLTTCGFGTSDFTQWLPSIQLLLLAFMLIGGMTGSTSGGIKILRLQVLLSYLRRDLRRARHPRGVFVVRLGRMALDDAVVSRVVAFVTVYVIAILTGTVVISFLGADLITAASGVISDIGLVGPALGDAGPASNFLAFTEPSQVVLIFFMLLGRMEIYVLLLMFAAPAASVRNRVVRSRRRSARAAAPAPALRTASVVDTPGEEQA